MDARERRLHPGYALLVAAALLVLATLRWHGDMVAADPLWYAGLAKDIANDPVRVFAAPSNHPFEMRVGLTMPLALLYRALVYRRWSACCRACSPACSSLRWCTLRSRRR
ncbi:MAG: hypothetical protein HC863_02785, partial [Myxococcales bacterium]|nr:hypothetical protein [Myxococcales bacterium]